VIVMAHPLADRSVRIPSMVDCRTWSNEVQVDTFRLLHPPLDVQLMPAADSWLVACACVRNVAAFAGAAKASTRAAVNAEINAAARVTCLDMTPPAVELTCLGTPRLRGAAGEWEISDRPYRQSGATCEGASHGGQYDGARLDPLVSRETRKLRYVSLARGHAMGHM